MSVLLAMTLALAAPQADMARKVSFESVAKPVSRMLPEISKATGMNLMSTGVTQDDVLVIRVVDVPLSELMKRIADVTNAEWKAEGDGYRLVRPEILAREERKAEYAARVAAAQKMLASYRERIAKRPAFDPEAVARRIQAQRTPRPTEERANDWRALESLGESVPLGRALQDAVASFSAEELASLEPLARIVFSSRPNRMQRPMPPAMAKAVSRFVAEQARYAEVGERILSNQEGAVYYGGMALHYEKAFDPAGKVLLIVMPHDGFSYRFTLRVVGASGSTIGDNSAFLHPMMEMSRQPMEMPKDDPKEHLPLSEDSEALMKAVLEARQGAVDAYGRRAQEGLKLPDALRARLNRPDLHDPLSLISSDMVLGWAKLTNRNLVANLPDTALNAIGFSYSGTRPSLPIVRMWLQFDPSITSRESEQWIEIEPTFATTARLQRVDRRALTRLVGAFAAKGRVSLEDRVQFALSSKTRDRLFMGETYIQFVGSRPGPGMEVGGSQELLRFHGLTPPALRARLTSGDPVPLAALSPQQLVELERMVYHQEYANLYQEGRSYPGFGIGQVEPTEALPNGLPRNGSLTLDMKSGDVALPRVKEGEQRVYWEPMDADALAAQLSWAERPELYPWANENPFPKTFAFGTQQTFSYNFEFGEGVKMQQKLLDRDIGPKVMTLDELPARFRNAVREKLEELRKGFEKRAGG